MRPEARIVREAHYTGWRDAGMGNLTWVGLRQYGCDRFAKGVIP
jgi:hypothetical protein